MRCYKYKGLKKFSVWIERAVATFMAMVGLLTGGRLIYLQFIGEEERNPAITIIALGFITLAIFVFIYIFNFKPNIYLDEHHLYVRFFLVQKEARLEDIIEVKKISAMFREPDFVILFSKGLTSFHRIYGLGHGSGFYLGVHVHHSISDRDDLEAVLKEYVR